MTEYIERESVERLMVIALDDDWDIVYTLARMREIPSADVRPIARGRWISKHDKYAMSCSVCNSYTENANYKYCPYCGAMMEDEK